MEQHWCVPAYSDIRKLFTLLCKEFSRLSLIRTILSPPCGHASIYASCEGGILPSRGVGGVDIKIIHNAHQVYIPGAYSYTGDSYDNQIPGFMLRVPPRYVVKVLDGTYRNAGGFYEVVILDSRNQILSELSPDVNMPSLHRIYEDLSIRKRKTFSEPVVCLATPGARNNYFHWLLELVPKLSMVMANRLSGCSEYKYIVNGLKSNYQVRSLRSLDIASEDIIWSTPGDRVTAETLIVPSHCHDFEVIPEWSVRYLETTASQRLILQDSPLIKSSSKLFVYRSTKVRRRIVNLEDTISLLVQLGYCPVDPGNLSIEEQATIFQGAECIIAEHGAALANLVFCQKCTRLLEIFSPYWTPSCYRTLAYYKGISYMSFIGESLAWHRNGDRSKIARNYYLPLSPLKVFLKLHGFD